MKSWTKVKLEMEEGSTKDSTDGSMDLRNLETKVGMKIPESLLRWTQADVQNYNMPVSECLPVELFTKIQTLKLEMRKLRSEDVKILQQLEALNEGVECMRWLWEENICQSCLSTNQSSQHPTCIPMNQTISDLDQDNHQPPSLTPAEQAKAQGYEPVVDQSLAQNSSSQPIMKPEIHKVTELEELPIHKPMGMLLGQVDSVDVQCSEARWLVALQNKENDQDSGLLSAGQLPGYDIHWRWVEHEDDVMFL